MPWFCGSSRRKSKARVCGVNVSNDDSVLGNRQSSLAVLLQDFTATTQDELTVVRGQVIELFGCDGIWRYVKDMDGKCGYVPNAFCYPLDQVASRGRGQWGGNGNDIPRYPKHPTRPRTLHLDELMLQGVSDSPEDGNEQVSRGTSSSTNRAPAENVHQATPPGNTTPPERAIRVCSPAQEAEIMRWRDNVATSSCSSGRSSGNSPRYASTPRPLHSSVASASCFSETGGSRTSGPVHSQGSLHSREGDAASPTPHRTSTPVTRDETPELPTPFSTTPQPPSCVSDSETESNQPLSSCHRRHSTERRETASQEYSLTAEEEEAMDELSELQTTLVPRHQQPVAATPSPLPVIAVSEPNYDHLESYDEPPVTVRAKARASVPDDIFSDIKKPQGIFRCKDSYKAQFEGQVSLQRNELVIVLEFGQGEWAWVFTSTSAEGLVPKSILEKYQPRLWMAPVNSTDQLSTGTQTELIVSGAVRQLRVLSSSGAACTSESDIRGSASPCSRASSDGAGRAEGTEVASIGVQTEFVSPEWFKHNASPRHDSIGQRLPNPSVRNATSTPQPRTPPKLELPLHSRRLNTTLPNSPMSLAGSPMPVSQSKPRFVSLNALGETRQRAQCRRRLARSESEPGCSEQAPSPLANAPLLRKLKPQTPILTAARDYQPPVNGKNCLSLKKGDVLYQQSHVPYPNGWMWVYHSSLRSFGYVPKSHVAYMYLVQRTRRPQSALLEVEV